jgi:hypothetical protein
VQRVELETGELRRFVRDESVMCALNADDAIVSGWNLMHHTYPAAGCLLPRLTRDGNAMATSRVFERPNKDS